MCLSRLLCFFPVLMKFFSRIIVLIQAVLSHLANAVIYFVWTSQNIQSLVSFCKQCDHGLNKKLCSCGLNIFVCCHWNFIWRSFMTVSFTVRLLVSGTAFLWWSFVTCVALQIGAEFLHSVWLNCCVHFDSCACFMAFSYTSGILKSVDPGPNCGPLTSFWWTTGQL
jgi:hypothetical protein